MWVTINKEKTAQNIKDLIKIHGYTVKEIAKELNVSEQTIYRYTYAGSIPRYETIIAMSLLFGEPIESIIEHDVRW